MQDQPANETPQQAVERELRAAQAQVREVAETLRAALADDERHEERHAEHTNAEHTNAEHTSAQQPNAAQTKDEH